MFMQRSLALSSLLCASFILMGCTPAPVAVPVKPKPKAVAVKHKSPVQKWISLKIDLTEEPPAPEEWEVTAETKSHKPRFLLLTSVSPIVVEMAITINDQPHENRLRSLVEQTLKLADVDGDGIPTWDEAFTVDVIKSGLLGNVELPNENARQQARRLYDIDSDDRVDADELPRFLTRNAGGSRSFSLRSFPSSPGYTAGHSPLRKILDLNHDGAISQAEWNSASTHLLLRDANDDGSLAGVELQPTGTIDEAAANRGTGPRTSFVIEDATDYRRIEYAMKETFGYGAPPRKDGFVACPELFTHLDADDSGEIERKEWPLLKTAPAQLKIAMAFYDNGEDTLKIEDVSEALAENVLATRESPGVISLTLPGGKVNVFINDQLPGGEAGTRQAEQFLQQYDADSNGYIDEDEAESAPTNLLLSSADENGDGKVYIDEIKTMFAKRNEVIAAQIRGRAIHDPLPLLAWLDTDGDGRLTPREIETVKDHLQNLDANADQQVTIDEIPTSIEIAFVRGDAQQRQQLFVRPALPPKSNNGPNWFVEMDLNRDGLVSSREFLGGEGRFKKFDANSDGYLSVDEVQQIPARSAGE